MINEITDEKSHPFFYSHLKERTQHLVPGEIAVALMTHRSEILSAFRIKIENGHVPTTEELLGLLDLLDQSIADWNKVTKLQKELTDIRDFLNETSKYLDVRAVQIDSISKDFNAVDRNRRELWNDSQDELQ